MAASDLDGTWRKFFLRASRSFLYSSGTLYPSGKQENEEKTCLWKFQIFPFICTYIPFVAPI